MSARSAFQTLNERLPQVFESVLVANRGEIASRVIHTVRAMGLKAVAVYSEADADLPFVAESDESILIGGARPADSYLDIDAIVEAAKRTGVQAVHPGDGFLAESAAFARRIVDEGLIWIGPSPSAIARLGDRAGARDLMAEAGVPVALASAPPVADVENARRVEVQILGLADGTVIALGERECSLRHRQHKIVEETPSPGVSPELRDRMLEAAVLAGSTVGYHGAGTVEYLVDPATQEFVFVEMHARMQAEHPVTELVTGIDLVEQQILIAAGRPVSCAETEASGHAIEFRVNAEDHRRFQPASGEIKVWEEPVGEGIRIDAGYAEGNTVTSIYDPLLAKLCVHGIDRNAALSRARQALDAFRIEGVPTNLPFFADLLDDAEFISGDYDTRLADRIRPKSGL